MNVQETLAIIEALRSSGATHFKSNDFEITLRGGAQPSLAHTQVPEGSTPSPATTDKPTDPAVAAANEKLKELLETVQMTPEQLADKMFPDGAV